MRLHRNAVFALLLLWGAALAAGKPVNLCLQPGVKLTADCHHQSFTPAKAADGNQKLMASRWLSRDETGDHWLEAAFPNPQEVNSVTLSFWKATRGNFKSF